MVKSYKSKREMLDDLIDDLDYESLNELMEDKARLDFLAVKRMKVLGGAMYVEGEFEMLDDEIKINLRKRIDSIRASDAVNKDFFEK